MNNCIEIRDRTIVVTGATGGLGRFVSHRLAELGAHLVLVGTNSQNLADLGSELPKSFKDWQPMPVDLRQPDSAGKIVQAAVDRFGRVDILFHFVGGWMGGKPVSQVQPEEINTMLQQHLWTTFYLAQAFTPLMTANDWGRIVVISSPIVDVIPANRLPYTIGKSAQEALILTLAKELVGSHVTANVLRVNTIDVDHEREKLNASAPLERQSWTTPEEILAALLYLCSEEGRVVNGARIPLYGSDT
jgi:NAD(P)-dependent dehydrogenase (short-subunit alcohol dehydrogenase family)